MLEKTLESPLDCKEIEPVNPKGNQSWVIHWKDWRQYFGHLMGRTDSFIRLWCWERLRAGGEGDDRGWNGWMASPTRWTWVWVGSRSWWWTGKPVVLQSMGSHDWATEMNWLSHYRILSKSDLYGKSITLQVEHRLPQNTSIHRETLKDPPPLSENYCDI